MILEKSCLNALTLLYSNSKLLLCNSYCSKVFLVTSKLIVLMILKILTNE